MTDTIELLETIGGDASLRYAAADELAGVLQRAQASAEFAEAVVSGDAAPLRQAMGGHNEVLLQIPQTQSTAFLDSE